MSKFGLPCAFLVKMILIDFQLEKYMQFKEKDIKKFFLQYWRHSDVTKCDTVFSHESKSLYMEVLFTPTIIVFVADCCIGMVRKRLLKHKKRKVDFLWTSI